MREIEDCESKLHETRQLIDVTRDEKHQCELKLSAVNQHVQSLTLQLQQKDAEIERSRNLVRLSLLLLIIMMWMLLFCGFALCYYLTW